MHIIIFAVNIKHLSDRPMAKYLPGALLKGFGGQFQEVSIAQPQIRWYAFYSVCRQKDFWHF